MASVHSSLNSVAANTGLLTSQMLNDRRAFCAYVAPRVVERKPTCGEFLRCPVSKDWIKVVNVLIGERRFEGLSEKDQQLHAYAIREVARRLSPAALPGKELVRTDSNSFVRNPRA